MAIMNLDTWNLTLEVNTIKKHIVYGAKGEGNVIGGNG
jgi:hypothetical protein